MKRTHRRQRRNHEAPSTVSVASALRPALLALLVLCVAAFPRAAAGSEESPAASAGRESPSLSGFGHFLAVLPEEGNASFSVPRLRFSLRGPAAGLFRYKVQFDVLKDPILVDASLDMELSARSLLRFGQFKIPFSRENLNSSSTLDTIERPRAVRALCPGRDIGSSGRDVGGLVQVRTGALEWTAGLFNGAGINRADNNAQKDLAGRLVFMPSGGGLDLGLSVYRGRTSHRVGAMAVQRDRLGVDLAWSRSGFTLKSEFIQSWDSGRVGQGGYIQLDYYLLADRLQAVCRYDRIEGREMSLREAGVVLGLNVYFAPKTKLQFNAELVREGMAKTEPNVSLMAQLQVGL